MVELLLEKVGEDIYLKNLLQGKKKYVVNKIKHEALQILTQFTSANKGDQRRDDKYLETDTEPVAARKDKYQEPLVHWTFPNPDSPRSPRSRRMS